LRRRNITVPPTAYMKRVVMADKIAAAENNKYDQPLGNADNNKNKKDVFQNEFENEKIDSNALKNINAGNDANKNNVLQKARLYPYKPAKFYSDYVGASLNNNLLINRFQPFGGYNQKGPINLSSNTVINGLIKMGTSELMEDVKITGAFRISSNLKDAEWLMTYQNYKRRFDWGATYYRNTQSVTDPSGSIPGKIFTNLYQGNVAYPFDNSKRLALTVGIRRDKTVFLTNFYDFTIPYQSLKEPDQKKTFATTHLEYVYDNSLNPTQNIWNGLRYKVYMDWNTDISKEKSNAGKFNFNWGADVRYYYPIYRNFIWAGRAAADFSWGNQKTIYYLGGVDSWLMFGSNTKSDGTDRFFNTHNPADQNVAYAFQSLAVNVRGFLQNVANGNNAVVLNSEFRLPVFTTLFNRPINNAFLRNFQLIQFTDLGSAWSGGLKGIQRPSVIYGLPPVQIEKKAGGLGPFAGGYGFGARSTLLGYFLKFDAAWQMNGFFKGKPIMYVSMGLDF
jgi:hypothetical protein